MNPPAQTHPLANDTIPSPEDHNVRTRYEQAIRIGCLEMERITEEIIVPEFEKIGQFFLDKGYEAEIVDFDAESPTEPTVYLCGARLRLSLGDRTHTIAFTGDPHRFQFNLQAHADQILKIEEDVDYHRLTPDWFYKHILNFMIESFRSTNFTDLNPTTGDEWDNLQGPFTIKMLTEDDEYNVIAITEDLDEATRMGSMFCSTMSTQDHIVLFDHMNRKVC